MFMSLQLCTYGSATTAIQQILARPLRRGRRDPPPPPNRLRGRDQQHPQIDQDRDSDSEEDGDNRRYLAAGDAPLPRRSGDEGGRARVGGAVREREDGWRREGVRQRPTRPRENQRKVTVETLRNADRHYSGDETDHPRLTEEGVEREEGEAEGVEGAEGYQAAAAAAPSPAPDAKEVVKGEEKKKEQPLGKKEQSVDKKEQPGNKQIKDSNSQHAELDSEGERTMRPSGGQQTQQSTAPSQDVQSQGASAPEQISALQGLNVSVHNTLSNSLVL